MVINVKIGNYVRFKDKRGNQYIRKIVEVCEEYPHKAWGAIIVDKKANNVPYVSSKNIIETDSDITKLLKPHDLLLIDISPDNYGGIVVPRMPETYCELNQRIDNIKLGNCVLKGVITKEQIENMTYEIEK